MMTQLDTGRVERIKAVMEALLAGRFDPQGLALNVTHEDAFAELETMLTMFATEYAAAMVDNERMNQERLATIERQRAAIAELSTPIIDIWDDVLTLPIVGIVDTQRSVDMTEKLLSRISEKRARCVIVDLTGVEMVDTMTADHLIKMIRAAQMLGSTCVVTGISPAIAQTLVELNVDLGGVRTLRSLKEGLRACIKELDRDGPGALGGRKA